MEKEGESSAVETAMNRLLHSNKLKVMVTMDDCDDSFYALQWTLSVLLKSTVAPDPNPGPQEDAGCMVFLVHVQQPFHKSAFPVGPGLPSHAFASASKLDSMKKEEVENSTSLLGRALKICNAHLVKAEVMILEGEPKDMICEATKQMPVDLLVVGSRGLGKIKRAFLGSVSDYCAHHASCPVLIVRTPKPSNS